MEAMVEIKPDDTEKIQKECTAAANVTCQPKKILEAVSILRQLNDKFYESTKKKPLLDDAGEKTLFLQVTMKKIPPQRFQKSIKVHLPNSFVTESSEICLITGDLDKRNKKAETDPDVLHYKELLKKEGITQVNEVITLRQLRKEYKPFEARRKLAGAYDTFLCDKKIAGVLPRTLGKHFFKKRKFPIQINMNTSNLKKQIDNALSLTAFHLSCKGNSCSSEVANLTMKDEELLSNISACVEAITEQIPGKLDNILGLYIKTDKSKSVPIFMSFDSPNEVKLDVKRSRNRVKEEELSTLDNAFVKVFKDGRIVVRKAKSEEEACSEVEGQVLQKVETDKEDGSPAKRTKLNLEDSPIIKKPKPDLEGSKVIKKAKPDVKVNKVVKKTKPDVEDNKIVKKAKLAKEKGKKIKNVDKKLSKRKKLAETEGSE